MNLKHHVLFNENLGKYPPPQTVQHLGIPFLLKMQHEVLFFSPHFIGDTLNTKAESVKDSLICRKYLFLAKTFALRSMGIQLVLSPLYRSLLKIIIIRHLPE